MTPPHPDLPDLPELTMASVARACARHPASSYRDLLARSATGGALGARELLTWSRAAATSPTHAERLPDAELLDAERLGGLALAMAGLVDDRDITVQDVAAVLDLAHRVSGRNGLPARSRDLWLDALFLTGQLEQFPYPRSDAVQSPHWRVNVDQLNPFLGVAGSGASDGAQARWLAELGRPFTEHGLAPLDLAPGTGAPMHRLSTPAVAGSSDAGPLVTVVMPAFDPAEPTPFALTSVLQQSWANLEVLLCDDGSGPDGRELLSHWAGLDPRVRVLRADRNQGAYAARNLGLAQARGEFVAFADIDDWAHPQRIERQVQPLLDDPAAMASMSRMVRTDDQLATTVLGYPAGGVNASSLLLRRVPVLSRLGGFDTVRRAADNELAGRLQAVFGDRALLPLPAVLTLVQRTPGSLSRDDIRLLFKHPARAHYRFGYRRWHERIRAGKESGWLPPPQRAPVPAMARVSGAAWPASGPLDVAVLAGAGFNAPTSPDLGAEVAALSGMGLRTGVADLPAPFDLTVQLKRPADTLVDLISSGHTAWLLPEDGWVTSLALVRDPAALLYLGNAMGPVRTTTALLVADYAPAGRYDPAQVEAVIAEICGASIRWLPATEAIAAELAAHVGHDNLASPALVGIAPPAPTQSWASAPQPVVGVVPPSGRLAPRMLRAWADATVPRDPRTRLWCLARQPRLAKLLGRTVATPGRPRLSELAFLRQVSYLTVPPTPGRGPHLDRDILCAMQHGCVVFLDPTYRQHFGDAALYPDDRSVDEWIGLHAEHPELYRQQQLRAGRFLRTQLSTDALQGTLRSVLDGIPGKAVHAPS